MPSSSDNTCQNLRPANHPIPEPFRPQNHPFSYTGLGEQALSEILKPVPYVACSEGRRVSDPDFSRRPPDLERSDLLELNLHAQILLLRLAQQPGPWRPSIGPGICGSRFKHLLLNAMFSVSVVEREFPRRRPPCFQLRFHDVTLEGAVVLHFTECEGRN